MNKKRSSFLSIGIPSMCIIFSVLCLAILALLTLGTSRQDLQTSQLTLNQTTAYYTACSNATKKYQELTDYAKNALINSTDLLTYNEKMSAITEQFSDTTWEQKTQTLSFTETVTDEQSVYIEVSLSYPSDSSYISATPDSSDSSHKTSSLSLTPEILTWKTISTADWNPNTKQPVYKGDSK